jgi:hypothetical protein
LYAEHGEVKKEQRSSPITQLSRSQRYEPIDCFNHALKIYTRQEFPEYRAVLQHNLRWTYFDRGQDNLEQRTLHQRQADLVQTTKKNTVKRHC